MGILGQKRWQIAPPAPANFFERLPAVPPLVAQILYNRGVTRVAEVEAFLTHSLDADTPFVMQGMDRAVMLVRRMIAQDASIVVYGDYDVDGVTASAVLLQTLRSLGGTVRAYIPNREDEGYGLNPEAIRALAAEGIRMMITVDCGIRSLDEVALARQLGMQVIITDHHHLAEALPQANAILNPRLPDCRYPFKDLAGVGVAYKLAQALLRTNKQVPLAGTRVVLEEAALLDLVALGTVADMVPLLGENHVLVAQGLERINTVCRPGLHALLDVVGVPVGKVTTTTIGFALSPRLNAAGRISEAMTALNLLVASDLETAVPLARELDRLNQERRVMTTEVQERARTMIVGEGDSASFGNVPPLLFAAAADFPHGVVGLAASRLLDEFYRPAVVVSIEGEVSKGSARSIPEFHITQALDAVADLLVRHGGHAAAAGFTVRTELLPELKSRLVARARAELVGVPLTPSFPVDVEVPLEMLSWELQRELDMMQPFGYGNVAPVFVSRGVRVRHARAVGADGRHLKMVLADKQGRTWDAIAFRQGAWIGQLPDVIDLAYVLEVNEWNGRVTLQLNVKDVHC